MMKKEKGGAVLLLALTLVVPGACGRNEAPLEEPAQPSAAATAPGESSGLRFSAPTDWIEETPSSRMRQAQYRLPRLEGDPEDAELVVFYFQGQGGSVQANIDRWVGQFSKVDGSPAADLATVTQKEAHGIPLTVVDVSGTYRGSAGPMMAPAAPKPDFRMLAAVAETSGGPWFFKLTGPARTVAKWEASFHAFLQSIEPSP